MPPETSAKKMIGRYEVGERIGAGGMGVVYRARHLDLDREVALKVLPIELVSRPDMLTRFRQEARHAAQLRHENIVTLFEIGEFSGIHYLAMEYVPGTNLHEYITSKKRLDPEEARKLIMQAARALTLAHKQGIVHRDIKPSNFLVTFKENKSFVKLADFGLARTQNEEDLKLTRTGTTVGSVDYISPEQARDSRSADIRSDIYSLGCTLFHMLAGLPPFPEGDMTARLLKHVEAQPPDICSLNAKVSPGLKLILERMLAKKPEDRYQNPADLLKALENVSNVPIVDVRGAIETLAAFEKNRTSRSGNVETKKNAQTPIPRPPNTPKPGEVGSLHFRHMKKKARKKVIQAQEPADGGVEHIAAWVTLAVVICGVIVLGIMLMLGSRSKKAIRPRDPIEEEVIEEPNELRNARPDEKERQPAQPPEPAADQPLIQKEALAPKLDNTLAQLPTRSPKPMDRPALVSGSTAQQAAFHLADVATPTTTPRQM